jgi:mono/diheme cytochrome c family protein
MSRRGFATLLAAAALLVLAGCGDDQRTTTTTGQAQAHARTMRLGASVFAEHCQTCHPLLGRPDGAVHSDFYPGLDLDQVSPAPAFARRMVRSGFVGMGGFQGVLSTAQQRAVVAYVLAVGSREVAPPPGTSDAMLTHGRRLYDENCQACHQLRGRAPMRPDPGWVGTNFDELRPGVLWTERIVRDGLRIAMPPFHDRLTLRETRALALYVNAAARGGLPPLR